jgi:hypothetical protein
MEAVCQLMHQPLRDPTERLLHVLLKMLGGRAPLPLCAGVISGYD